MSNIDNSIDNHEQRTEMNTETAEGKALAALAEAYIKRMSQHGYEYVRKPRYSLLRVSLSGQASHLGRPEVLLVFCYAEVHQLDS